MSEFDGTNWTTYTTSNSGLADNDVWAIAIDGAGHKWFGTRGGVSEFIPGGVTYTISGQVRDGSSDPIYGVTVSAGAGGSATTDASGAYAITGLVTGAYTLTPSKSGWTFTPATRTVSVPPDATGQDFTGYTTGLPLCWCTGFKDWGCPGTVAITTRTTLFNR